MIKIILPSNEQHAQIVEQVLAADASLWLTGMPAVRWGILADGKKVIGVAVAYAITDVRTYVDVILPGENMKHPDRKQALKDWVEYLLENVIAEKFEAFIPTSKKGKIRYFQQAGFQREGVSKKSALRDDELVDQQVMGMSR